MKITKLEYQKKNPNRVNVYVDEKFAVGMDTNDLLKLGLYAGLEIPPQKLVEIVNESESGKLYSTALNFISFRPRSEKEIRDMIKKKIYRKTRLQTRVMGSKTKDNEVDNRKRNVEDGSVIDTNDLERMINGVIERLKEKNFLNDLDFAKWFVDQRSTFKQKGKAALTSELFSKGINSKIVSQVLSDINRGSENDLAQTALLKKTARRHIDFTVLREKQKLIEFLVRRGFDWDVAANAVEKLAKK